MQRKKENRSSKKSRLILVGSLLIIFGICIVSGKYIYNYYFNKIEDIKIQEFYKEQEKIDTETVEPEKKEDKKDKEVKTETKIDYVAVIKIPKINLEKGLCKKGTWCNNVNKNIQILDEASYPDSENGNFILAGHSGSGRTAYFKNLYKLQADDEVSIFYNGHEYKYKVVNQYDIEKTGTANIVRNAEKNTLTLITCRQGTKKQIIYICELVEKV